MIHPTQQLSGSALSQDRHGGVVGMDALGREDVSADGLDQRHQGRRRGAYPVGKRRHVEVDAFADVDSALAIERQMQAELGE